MKALQGHGLHARLRAEQGRPGRHDAKIELALPGKAPRPYLVEIKRHATPATIGGIIEQMRANGATLLVADYIGQDVAKRLRQEKTQFADAAGNAFIEAPGTLIWVIGNRPQREPEAALRLELRRKTAARAFEPAGLKILFAFLCDPGLVNRPYRKIADEAGVAHGTVGWVMAELPHRGFVFDFGGDKGRQLMRIDELLAEWATAYARKLRPNLLLGRYRAKDPDWWKAFEPMTYGAVLGAEPAAAKITRHLRPEIITIYADTAAPRMLLDNGLRADPLGKVEVAKRFWHFDTAETRKGIAPLPLVYADLLATGEPRCLEAAGLVRERYLAARPAR